MFGAHAILPNLNANAKIFSKKAVTTLVTYILFLALIKINLKLKFMPKCVCNGAKIKCSFGSGPKSMVVLPISRTTTQMAKPLANQLDMIPFLNIPAFGQCKSPLNPMNWKMAGPVPVFVPSSCIPVPVMPWSPVATKTKIGKQPALLETSKTMCVWAGSIQFDDPGTKKIEIK